MTCSVVVPCFDEAARFDPGAFVQLAELVDLLVLVDDGSRDRTAALLDSLAESMLLVTKWGLSDRLRLRRRPSRV